MYKVNLEVFEGPLDLLLHLIKKEDIDIFDINIDKITKQYLDYINLMEKFNLDIASEYLIMAAELMEIKAKSLLPKSKNEKDDEYEEDPKEQLINKLIEYEQYKEMTNTFKEYEELRQEVYTRSTDELISYKEIDKNNDFGIDLEDLVKAFKDFLVKKELDKPLNTKIARKDYSVSRRCQEIKSIIKIRKKVTFYELFDILSKDYVVVTFLSILSLTKNGEIRIKQEHNFNNIIMEEVE